MSKAKLATSRFNTSQAVFLPPDTAGPSGSCRSCESHVGSMIRGSRSWSVWKSCPHQCCYLLCRAGRRWPELLEPSKRESWKEKQDGWKTTVQMNTLYSHLKWKINYGEGENTFPDRIFRPSPRLLECSCSSWILLDIVLWAGWGRVLAEVDRRTKGSSQAWIRERANDSRSVSCKVRQTEHVKARQVYLYGTILTQGNS